MSTTPRLSYAHWRRTYRTVADIVAFGLSLPCANSNIGSTCAPGSFSNASFAISAGFGSFGLPSAPMQILQGDSFRLNPAPCVTYGQWPHEGHRYSVPGAVMISFVSHVLHLKLSLIHISEPTRLLSISYAVF